MVQGQEEPKRLIIEAADFLAVQAEPSDVTSLRARLIRDGFYGEHEERQLSRITRMLLSGMSADEFEVQRRFGPWPKAQRDDKGRIIWSRKELAEMEPGLANLIKNDPKTVVK